MVLSLLFSAMRCKSSKLVGVKRNLFILLSTMFLLLGCQRPASDNVLHFAIAQTPQNLDPRYASDAASERVNRLVYQRLVEFDASAKPVAGLATWETLSTTSYRFTLKQNLPLFHHGKTLTADDVKATYESVMQLKGSPHATEFANIKAIQVLDAQTLQFDLKKPDVHFASKLIIGILPQDLINQSYDFSRKPVGNGPFKFSQWESKLKLERVNDALVVSFVEVKDPTVRVLKLLRGEVDLLQSDLPPELVKHLQSKDDVTVSFNKGVNFSYLGLNMEDALLSNHKVRLAIAHAIGRQEIINQVMIKNTRPAGAILPPEHYAGNATLSPYEYNPSKAKQLLSSAGIQLPFKLTYKTSTDAQRVRLATIMQAQMAPAGIELEIKSLDWGTFFADVKQGKFQLYGLTWVGIKTPEIYTKVFGSQFMPPKGLNRGRFADETADALLAKEDWAAATAYIHQQLPYIPLWYEGQFSAYRNTIKHYQPKPDGNWDGLVTVSLQ